jgi:nuclear pore complex protein Nup62
MDEILTRWATDLNKYQKDFQKQAGQVAEWDRLLVDNTDKIGKLVTKTIAAERDATEVERQLKSVEDQQSELEQFLDKYEGQVDELVRSHGLENESGVDAERDRTYKLAEKLTDRLDGLNKDLTDVIDEINNLGAMLNNSSGPDDPVSDSIPVNSRLLIF